MSSVKVVLPQLDLNQIDNPLSKVVMKGNKQFTVNTITADTQNENQVLFSFQPPSQNTIIDRRFMLQAKFNVAVGQNLVENVNFNRQNERGAIQLANSTVNNTIAKQNLRTTNLATNTGLVQEFRRDNNFVPRQMPLMSIIEVIDLEINGTHISVSPNDYIHALLRYTTPEFRGRYLNGSASYPDLVQEYRDSYGFENSLFAGKGNVGRKGENPRGICEPATSGTNLVYTFTEPLFISPLLMGGKYEGLTNVNQINISIRWSSDLRKAFSLFDIHAIGTANVNDPVGDIGGTLVKVGNHATTLVDNSCKLLLNYYTPQDDIKIPNEVVYPYNQPQNYIKNHTIPSLTQFTESALLIGDNIRINQIPECVYLFVKIPKSSKNAQSTDAHYPINQISVNWNNQNSLLQGATCEQLFQINKDNGLDAEFWEVGGTMNSVSKKIGYGVPLKLRFGKDIPLETGETAGMVGNYNLRIDIKFENSGAEAITSCETSTLLIMNGACIVSPNEMRLTLGNVDSADSMGAGDQAHHSEVSSGEFGLEGGSLWSSAKHMVKRGGRVAKKLAEACDKYSPALKKMGNMSGGTYNGGDYTGGKYSGGRR